MQFCDILLVSSAKSQISQVIMGIKNQRRLAKIRPLMKAWRQGSYTERRIAWNICPLEGWVWRSWVPRNTLNSSQLFLDSILERQNCKSWFWFGDINWDSNSTVGHCCLFLWCIHCCMIISEPFHLTSELSSYIKATCFPHSTLNNPTFYFFFFNILYFLRSFHFLITNSISTNEH